jgi:predicted enzyme related to lactoylglutathione lyase
MNLRTTTGIAGVLVVAALMLAGCAPSGSTPSTTSATSSSTPPAESRLINVVGVLPVADFDAAISWYAKLLGRDPDLEPDEGVAEWQIAENAWIQVSANPEFAGKTAIVIGVDDIEAHVADCEKAGIATGEIIDYGVVKLINTTDPAGNTVTFVQTIS